MTAPLPNPPTSCAVCGTVIVQKPGTGRYKRYCRAACGRKVRKAADLINVYERRIARLQASIARKREFLDRVGRTWR